MKSVVVHLFREKAIMVDIPSLGSQSLDDLILELQMSDVAPGVRSVEQTQPICRQLSEHRESHKPQTMS